MHGLTDQAEFEHRAIILDEARVRGAAAIAEVTGRKPKLSTTGGISDARFIKDYCPVLEFGLVGQTMHAVDEYAPVADFVALTAIYRRIIEKYFG